MIRNIIGCLLLVVVLAGCTQSYEVQTSQRHQLSDIDSLMWQRPDSALVVLLDYFAGSDTMLAPYDMPNDDSAETHAMRLYDKHYSNLLLAELLYKNDYAQANRTALRQAVAYFDSLVRQAPPLQRGARGFKTPNSNLVFLTARAHYINGVGYYENDSVVEACTEYLKTLETMETHFPLVETQNLASQPIPHIPRFTAYTYNRLGKLFSDQYMMKPSIDCYENSLVFSRIEPTSPNGVSIVLYCIGREYDKMEEMDRARQYYEQAKEEMPCKEGVSYRDLVALIATNDYELGSGMEQPMQALKEILKQTDDESEKLTRCLTIGYVFFEERMYDSALCYLEPVFAHSEDEVSQRIAAEYLQVIYDSMGEVGKSDECMRFMALHKKSEGENKALVSQLNDLFEHYMKNKQEKQAEKEQGKTIRKAVGMVILIVVAVLVALIVAKRKRRKQMEAERHAHDMEKAALSGRLKQRNQEVSELKSQIREQKEKANPMDETQAATFAEEPICRLIMERVNEGQFLSQMDCRIYKDYALDKNQLAALRRAADSHYNQFTLRIGKAHPELTRGDLDYCCLYLLGLTDADIAALMQRAYNTVNERNTKLRRVFHSENAISITLQAIANEKTSD